MTQTRSWNKLLPIDTNNRHQQLSQLKVILVLKLAHQHREERDVHDWLKVDNNDEGYQLLSDDDIVKQITQTDEEEDEEDEVKDVEDVPSSGEVKDTLNRCLLWYERQDECAVKPVLTTT